MTFFSSRKCSLSLLKDENFFSLNRSNGASKVHPKKVLAKKLFYQLKICLSPKKSVFWAKLFLGALFTKVICTFLKSVWKDGFFDTPFDLIKEKKFSSHNYRASVYFLWTKKPKMEETNQYRKMVFYKQVLEFHCPSKFLWHKSGRQNHWSLQHIKENSLKIPSHQIKSAYMCGTLSSDRPSQVWKLRMENSILKSPPFILF